MAETRMINLRVPQDLLNQLDQSVATGERSAFIIEAIEEKLHKKRLLESISSMTGIVREEEAPYWSTPEKVTQWVREQRNLDADKGIPNS